MNAPLKWISEYTPVRVSPDDFQKKMIMTGTAVEGYEKQGADFDTVVVGRLEKITKHENSDHLQVCQVNVGDKTLQIVTGAPNVAEGQLVPVAMDGAHLPGGVKIKKGKLRGVVSEGMLCSGPELGVPSDLYPNCGDEGILIFTEEHPLGQDVHDVFGLDDTVMDCEILANRPDCLSMWGLAREAAASLNERFTLPAISVREEGGDIRDHAKVDVLDSDLCTRYCARYIEDIQIVPSPLWMRKRLYAAGVRPINSIVDITNYVMLETGQPMHAFDFDTVRGGHIIVRRAKEGELLKTLDDKERALTDKMLVIADESGSTGLAGIMGGMESEITENTKRVLFEAACFNGANIRRTSRALGLRTEASGRFEHGVNVRQTYLALERACQLVQELGVGRVVSGTIDLYPNPEPLATVKTSVEYIWKLVGIKVPVPEMLEILETLGFQAACDGDELTCTAPEWRMDISCGADIAEEILRIYGYDKIPSTLHTGSVNSVQPVTRQAIYSRLRTLLCGFGYNEAETYSFMSANALNLLRLADDDLRRKAPPILNPLGEEYALMRTTMLPGMLQALALNINRGNPGSGLFELNACYFPKALPITDMVDEKPTLCMGLYGDKADFYAIKGTIEELLFAYGVEKPHFAKAEEPFLHPGRSAYVFIGGEKLGYLGEIHPDVAESFGFEGRAYVAELDIGTLLAQSSVLQQAEVLPKFPGVVRDMALVMKEEIPVGDVMEEAEKAAGKLCEGVELFDIYRGIPVPSGEKSVALSLKLRAPDRTLTEQEVTAVFEKTIRAVTEKFNAHLR